MSLILDALNRADQERSDQNSVPNLHSGHSAVSPSSSPLRRWILEGLIIALAGGAFLYTQQSKENAIGDKSTAEKTVPIPTQQTTASTTIQATVEKAMPVTKAADKTLSTKMVKAEPIKTASESLPSTDPGHLNQLAPSTAITSLYQQQAHNPVAQPPFANVNVQAVAIPTPAEPIDVGLAILQQIPLLIQMSSRFQNSIPRIDYSVHVYSETDNAGFVNLNGSIRKIGAQIAPSLIVIAILKDSVVLDYKGKQFRLMALNSWVNFN
ncbi:MAG: general secretion pathway protein GspB [Pseudomonadales bacterium]